MAEFKESAKDGDKDGAVQDGTEFERPIVKATVPKGAETHPAWFKELVDGTRNVVDQEEPEAVTRMRDV
jgi:hypothetical protein